MRPARPEDRAAPRLLYASAAPYYDAYAGSARQALRMLERIWPRGGHSASFELSRVAELDGEVLGAVVAFAACDSERLARRFLALTVPRMLPWAWFGVVRHLRASATVTPVPPPRSLYVDALAVAERHRRRGVATALLADAERRAAELGLRGVALDTGIENAPARALYEAYGFERTGVQEAPNERVARALGGRGFVSYFKPG